MNNKRKLNKILIFAKKLRGINILGGSCKRCGETNIHKLCFHHINPEEKEDTFNNLKYNRWTIIKNEIDKCEVLCHNCHTELHYLDKSARYSKKEKNKHIYLEYKGIDKCEICGYKSCIDSLQFHHLLNKKIEFRNIQTTFNSIIDLTNNIREELDVCKVICNNCHVELHTDTIFFNNNLRIIIDKSINMRENSKSIDEDKVKEMMNNNLSIKEMMSILSCKKSAIYDCVKKIRKDKTKE